MKLKSFGCSFIFGTDLPNDGRYTTAGTPSDHTYPALIAKDLGYEWSCHARPGSGNLGILHNIIEEVSKVEPALFMINWTWIDRFDYISEDPNGPRHFMNPLGWTSILPTDDNEESRVYYRHLHTQLRDKFQTLTCIKTAIDCLRANGHPFVMTWTDGLIWETEWHCPPAIAWLQQTIRPDLSSFGGLGFVEWSSRQGYAISPTMHPLEQAHRAAADMILEDWDSYLKVNNDAIRHIA